MEQLSIILVLLTFAQVTYLTYRTLRSARGAERGDILLDTSVLIDGRIEAILRSGLVTSKLVIPRSVVRELQFMADKADHEKRERARFGLDIIEKLQQLEHMQVTVIDDGVTSEHGVDEQLIILARRTGAKLCTIDYNLNKAARVQSVDVININELAHALRVMHLPGETIDLELVQPGQDKKQAVGYLDDGTMVVVEDSRADIGKTIPVELTRVLQTAAGRMMFAKPKRTMSNRSVQQPSKGQAVSKAAAAPQKRRLTRSHAGSDKTVSRDTSRRSFRHKQTAEDKLVDLANNE